MRKKTTVLGAWAKKNIVFFTVITALIALELFLFLIYGGGAAQIASYLQNSHYSVSGNILFYGNHCDNCTKVDNFIKANNIEKNIQFTRLEVFNNPQNERLLAAKAQACRLNPQQIGVPFFYDGKQCILGYVDIINYFLHYKAGGK